MSATGIVAVLVGGGLLAGTYGSLIGAGGGFIMVPLLLLLFPEEGPAVIAASSLFAVLFTGLSSTSAYAYIKRIDYKAGSLLGGATLPGAILGVHLLSFVPRSAFEIAMATLLIVLASYSFIRSRFGRGQQILGGRRGYRTLVDRRGGVFVYPVRATMWSTIALVAGFLSSMMGIGGGLLQVPILVYALDMPIQVAVATSQFALTATALAGTVTHLTAGNLSLGWWNVGALSASVVVGAQVGARLSTRFSGPRVTLLLSVGLMVVGIRLLVAAV